MDVLRIIGVAKDALEILNADHDSTISESERAGLLEAVKEAGGGGNLSIAEEALIAAEISRILGAPSMNAGSLGGASLSKLYEHFIWQVTAYNKEKDLIAQEKLIVPNDCTSLSSLINPASLYRLAHPGEADLAARFEVDVGEETLDDGTPVTKVRYTVQGDASDLGEFEMAMARAEQSFDPRVIEAIHLFREQYLPKILAESDAAEDFSGEVYVDFARFGEEGQYAATSVEFRVGINARPLWGFHEHISLGGSVQTVEDQSPGIDLPRAEAAGPPDDGRRIEISSLNAISEGNGGLPLGLDIAEFVLTGGAGALVAKGVAWGASTVSKGFFSKVGAAVAAGGGRGGQWRRLIDFLRPGAAAKRRAAEAVGEKAAREAKAVTSLKGIDPGEGIKDLTVSGRSFEVRVSVKGKRPMVDYDHSVSSVDSVGNGRLFVDYLLQRFGRADWETMEKLRGYLSEFAKVRGVFISNLRARDHTDTPFPARIQIVLEGEPLSGESKWIQRSVTLNTDSPDEVWLEFIEPLLR